MTIENLTPDELEELYLAAIAMRTEYHFKTQWSNYSRLEKAVFQKREQLLSAVAAKLHEVISAQPVG